MLLVPGYDLYECVTEGGCTTTDYVLGAVGVLGVGKVVSIAGKLFKASKVLRKYDVGTFDTLKGRSVPGDDLDVHHAVQKQPAAQIIEGYDPSKGPSIALPRNEHLQIPNLRGEYNGSPRDLLARDIRNLRNYTEAPNKSLQELVELNKQTFPGAFAK